MRSMQQVFRGHRNKDTYLTFKLGIILPHHHATGKLAKMFTGLLPHSSAVRCMIDTVCPFRCNTPHEEKEDYDMHSQEFNRTTTLRQLGEFSSPSYAHRKLPDSSENMEVYKMCVFVYIRS